MSVQEKNFASRALAVLRQGPFQRCIIGSAIPRGSVLSVSLVFVRMVLIMFAVNFGATRYERCPHCTHWHWTRDFAQT